MDTNKAFTQAYNLTLTRFAAAGVPLPPDLTPIEVKSVNEVVREYADTLLRFCFDALRTGDKIDFRREHKELIREIGPRAYAEGLREGGKDPDEQDKKDGARIEEWVENQVGFVNAFADWLVSVDDDGERNTEAKRREMRERVNLWVAGLRELAQTAAAAAQGDPMLRYDGEDGKESCEECQEYKGQVHRLSTWEKWGLLQRNGNPNFTCGRWDNCHHSFFDAKTGKLVIA